MNKYDFARLPPWAQAMLKEETSALRGECEKLRATIGQLCAGSAKPLLCPFCTEDDFDHLGLKGHLLNDCEPFRNTTEPTRIF